MTFFNALLRTSVLVATFALAACGGEEEAGTTSDRTSNTAPVISGAPDTTARVGEVYVFEPSATDAEGDTLTFSIRNRPGWATFSPITGRFTGTPPPAAMARYRNIEISVTDGTNTASLPPFDLNVDTSGTPPVNSPPTIGGTPSTSVVAGNAYSFTPTASDPDGDTLVFSVAGAPSWAQFNAGTGRLSGSPTEGDVGTTAGIVITVDDGTVTRSLPPFSIDVTSPPPPPPVNRPPVISGSPPTTVTAGQAYSFTPTASDPDGQVLRFGIAHLPAWATFDEVTGRLSGTPGSTGTHSNIVISVSDGTDSATLPAFTIQVTAANRPPVISGTPASVVTAGQPYGFTPTASDPDGQALTFSITGRPTWANFNASTGRLSGTPGAAGTYRDIVIRVTDGIATVSLPAFSITVEAPRTGSATLRWTPPTLNEDGSPINNLDGYRIYYGTNSSDLSTVLDVPDPGMTSAVVEGLTPATWYFALRAYNTLNVESALSNIASKTIQ